MTEDVPVVRKKQVQLIQQASSSYIDTSVVQSSVDPSMSQIKNYKIAISDGPDNPYSRQ